MSSADERGFFCVLMIDTTTNSRCCSHLTEHAHSKHTPGIGHHSIVNIARGNIAQLLARDSSVRVMYRVNSSQTRRRGGKDSLKETIH
jgi:hypothetical protein